MIIVGTRYGCGTRIEMGDKVCGGDALLEFKKGRYDV